MNCPKCGKFARRLGTMRVTTQNGQTQMMEVFQCVTCKQEVHDYKWPLEFVKIGDHSETVRPTGYD